MMPLKASRRSLLLIDAAIKHTTIDHKYINLMVFDTWYNGLLHNDVLNRPKKRDQN